MKNKMTSGDKRQLPVNEKQESTKYYIKAACEGEFTAAEVARRLGISRREVFKLKARYRAVGDKAFTHGNIGRAPATKIPEETREKIVTLKLSDKYKDCPIKEFAKALNEEHGMKMSMTSVRNILQENKINYVTRKMRPKELRAPPRKTRNKTVNKVALTEWLGRLESELDSFDNTKNEMSDKITSLRSQLNRENCDHAIVEAFVRGIKTTGNELRLKMSVRSSFKHLIDDFKTRYLYGERQ